jgi:hypothetical protein
MKRTFLIEKYKQILNVVIEKLSQTNNNKKPVGRPNKFDNNFYLKYIFRILFYDNNPYIYLNNSYFE